MGPCVVREPETLVTGLAGAGCLGEGRGSGFALDWVCQVWGTPLCVGVPHTGYLEGAEAEGRTGQLPGPSSCVLDMSVFCRSSGWAPASPCGCGML
jgi:hypothetical protein